MVAFKEEFPYLRSDSGQLFEFNRAWLHAEIKLAADRAGYDRRRRGRRQRRAVQLFQRDG